LTPPVVLGLPYRLTPTTTFLTTQSKKVPMTTPTSTRAHAQNHPQNQPQDHSHTQRTFIGRAFRVSATLVILCNAVACAGLAKIDSNALWKIVDIRCVPSQQATGTPGQCEKVDLDKRYVILKDIFGRSQYLLIPTDRMTGIESPLVLAPHAQNYWVDAWDARHYVETAVHRALPDDQLGLEINSAYRRSQNQLHIHIDCLRSDVSAVLASHAKDAPDQWRWQTIDGERYRIMRVSSLAGAGNPFRVVAHDNRGAAAMATQTILVTGAGPDADADGWLLVNSGTEVGDGSGSAEGLMDHACRVADAN
jgi:CDP-diacylglycerol pyrophosphatase